MCSTEERRLVTLRQLFLRVYIQADSFLEELCILHFIFYILIHGFFLLQSTQASNISHSRLGSLYKKEYLSFMICWIALGPLAYVRAAAARVLLICVEREMEEREDRRTDKRVWD